MRIACWIPKVTNTHLQYVILITFHYNSGYTDASQCYVIHTVLAGSTQQVRRERKAQ